MVVRDGGILKDWHPSNLHNRRIRRITSITAAGMYEARAVLMTSSTASAGGAVQFFEASVVFQLFPAVGEHKQVRNGLPGRYQT